MCHRLGFGQHTVKNVIKSHNLQTRRSKKMTEQSKLRQQGLQKCWSCNSILELNDSNFSPNNRTCKPCCNNRATKSYYSKFESLEKLLEYKIKKSKRHGNDLTLDDLLTIYENQNCKCFYTQREFVLSPSHPDSVSIDRIDSNLGYTKNNVVLCCSEINYMKQSQSRDRFIENCKLISSLFTF